MNWSYFIMKHLSFPSIEQFRNVVNTVRNRAKYDGIDVLPTITFRGTVKSHGTNASIVYDRVDNVFYAQSRSNVLSLENDNAGFCQFFENNREYFENLLKSNSIMNRRYTTIYGEWCGGNIQKGVAINGLPKMFLVFAICFLDLESDDNRNDVWVMSNLNEYIKGVDNKIGVYHIESFPTFDIKINFNHPELVQNQLVTYTEEIENECPIGKYFGVSGTGEGIVYSPIECSENFNLCGLMFKVKGEKHSVSKVKTLAAVDVEVINSMNELVDSLATLNRFEQGITVFKEQGIDINDSKNTKLFIDWVKNDVIKEDKDTILASGLDFGKIVGNISSKAGKWFNSR
jgi:hypothetical protein